MNRSILSVFLLTIVFCTIATVNSAPAFSSIINMDNIISQHQRMAKKVSKKTTSNKVTKKSSNGTALSKKTKSSSSKALERLVSAPNPTTTTTTSPPRVPSTIPSDVSSSMPSDVPFLVPTAATTTSDAPSEMPQAPRSSVSPSVADTTVISVSDVEQGFIQTTPDNSIVLIAGVVGAATLLVGGLVLAVLAYRRSEAEEEHAEEDAFVNA